MPFLRSNLISICRNFATFLSESAMTYSLIMYAIHSFIHIEICRSESCQILSTISRNFRKFNCRNYVFAPLGASPRGRPGASRRASTRRRANPYYSRLNIRNPNGVEVLRSQVLSNVEVSFVSPRVTLTSEVTNLDDVWKNCLKNTAFTF